MKKSYHSMARRFHPDKNIGLDTTEMTKITKESKDGLEETLRTNDEIREEEQIQAAEEEISISSDHKPDSESSDTSSKPAKSSSKESTLPAKHTNDNEETPLKKPFLDHGYQKRSFRNNQGFIFQVWRRQKP